RPQEVLEGAAAPRAEHEMQVRPHVGKIVDSHVEPPRHMAQHVAHGADVLAQRPRPSGSMARQNHVHWASCTDRPRELAPATPGVATVHGPRQLGLDLTTEEGQLHRHRSNVIIDYRGAMSFSERNENRISNVYARSRQSSYRPQELPSSGRGGSERASVYEP